MSVLTRTRTLAASVALAFVAVLAVSTPASAHDALVGSDPAPGSTLAAAPSQLTLTFSSDIGQEGAEVHVYEGADPSAAAAAGAIDIAAGAPVVDGTTVTVPLTAMPNGTYSVNWKVVSSDGHPISTSDAEIITFTVDVPNPVAEDPNVQALETPLELEPTGDSITDKETTADAPAAEEGVSPLVITVIAVGAVVVIGLIVTILAISRRNKA